MAQEMQEKRKSGDQGKARQEEKRKNEEETNAISISLYYERPCSVKSDFGGDQRGNF